MFKIATLSPDLYSISTVECETLCKNYNCSCVNFSALPLFLYTVLITLFLCVTLHVLQFEHGHACSRMRT